MITSSLRQRLVSAPLLGFVRRVLPPISETERAALDAGTVWWDAELFSGNPDWSRLLSAPPGVLSGREQSFLDNETEELCGMLDDWRISTDLALPDDAWTFMRDKG